MTNDEHFPPGSEGSGAADEQLQAAVAHYLDRLNSGERLDPIEILAEHPDRGEAILKELRAFLDLGSGTEAETALADLGILGDYTLRRQIGRGGMGVVYEAWENSMNRRVALKVLPAGIASDPKALTRFVREAQVAGNFHHPNVVPVYGMGVKNKTPFFAMEFVEGETLAQILPRLRDAEPEAQTVFGTKDRAAYFEKLADAFADVADGLQHAHSKGVIHRDVKPSNLILAPDGRLRILDFGLARLDGQESLTLSGDFVGTPLYMSPEQARRRKIPIDHRTDVYSLGATLYEMLTLRPPFQGKDHADTLSQIIEREPLEPRRLNPRVPKDLETIVLKCLSKEAGDRYGTAEAMGQDLKRLLRGDPIEARPPAAWERLARRVSRHRRKLIAAAGLSALLLVCGMLTWRLRLERQTSSLYLAQDYEKRVVAAAMKLLRGERVLVPTGASAREYLLPRRYQDLLTGSGKLVAKEAVAELTRAVADLPDRFEGYYYRAKGRKLLGDNAGSIDDLRECLGRNPRFLPARALLSDLERAGDDREKSFPSPASDGTDRWGGTWLRAHQAMRREAWKEATAAYGELLTFEEGLKGELFLGSSIENLIGRGVARMETSDFEGAKLDFWAARTLSQRLWGEFLEPLLLLGKAYFLQGDPSRTESLFLDALGRAGDRKKAALWMAAVYQSLIPDLERSGRTGEAVAAAKKAVQLYAEDDAARLRLGWTLLRDHWSRRQGNANGTPVAGPDALQEIESLVAEALAHNANETSAYFLWSKALEAQGKLELASELSEKAEALLGGADSSTLSRRQDMNIRNLKSMMAVAATLSLGLGAEGRAHEPEGTFTDLKGLEGPINSPFLDVIGGVSGDGVTLVFNSDRPGGSGDVDIYIAERQDPKNSWQVRNVAELNTGSADWVTFLSEDALILYYYVSSQPDLYVATRAARGEPFENPQPLCGINTEFFEAGLTLTADGLEAYFISDRPGGEGDRDIWVATTPVDKCFTVVRNLGSPINTPSIDAFPSISANGLTLFWSDFPTDTPRPGGKGGADIWCASRASRGEEFGEPVNLGSPINTSGRDFWIRVSPRWPEDASLVYFTRCLDANCDDMDIYQATWCLTPPPPPPPRFLRGDCNGDGAVSGVVTDAVFMLNFNFLGGPAPPCVAACDADADGAFSGTVTDAVYVLNFNFLGGPPPAAPFPECAASTLESDAALGCESPPAACSGQ